MTDVLVNRGLPHKRWNSSTNQSPWFGFEICNAGEVYVLIRVLFWYFGRSVTRTCLPAWKCAGWCRPASWWAAAAAGRPGRAPVTRPAARRRGCTAPATIPPLATRSRLTRRSSTRPRPPAWGPGAAPGRAWRWRTNARWPRATSPATVVCTVVGPAADADEADGCRGRSGKAIGVKTTDLLSIDCKFFLGKFCGRYFVDVVKQNTITFPDSLAYCQTLCLGKHGAKCLHDFRAVGLTSHLVAYSGLDFVAKELISDQLHSPLFVEIKS